MRHSGSRRGASKIRRGIFGMCFLIRNQPQHDRAAAAMQALLPRSREPLGRGTSGFVATQAGAAPNKPAGRLSLVAFYDATLWPVAEARQTNANL
jgi:hypothetical protein